MSAALAEAFPVGDHIAEELDARGWTQAEFAEILGRPAQFVSEILTGRKELTRESAAQIAAAFGTSARLYLAIQDQYHLWRHGRDGAVQQELDAVRLRARLNQLAPIGVMRQRGLLKGTTLAELECEIKDLHRISDISEDPELLVAARRSKADEKISGTQLAWIACVRRKAEEVTVARFAPKELERLAGRLTRMVADPDDLSVLPKAFAKVGVRIVFIEAFPGSKMDGCAFLLEDGRPVIGISGRGKRLDKVLFTILHEVAHIHLGHVNDKPVIIDDQGEKPTLGVETPADEQAAEWCVPEEVPALPQRINQGWITAVAAEQGIHPIVLIGRLQKRGDIPWKTTLVRDAPSVLSQLERW